MYVNISFNHRVLPSLLLSLEYIEVWYSPLAHVKQILHATVLDIYYLKNAIFHKAAGQGSITIPRVVINFDIEHSRSPNICLLYPCSQHLVEENSLLLYILAALF